MRRCFVVVDPMGVLSIPLPLSVQLFLLTDMLCPIRLAVDIPDINGAHDVQFSSAKSECWTLRAVQSTLILIQISVSSSAFATTYLTSKICAGHTRLA